MAKVGRPPKFEKPGDMEPLIEEYFNKCDLAEEPYTVPGLAYALGFADKSSLVDYSKNSEFSFTIKRAKARIESQRNRRLVDGKGNTAGMIFDLKNNFGWSDSRTIEHTGSDGGPIMLWGGKSG